VADPLMASLTQPLNVALALISPFVMESPFTPLVGALVGLALLLAGRRLFWLLVGAVGFLFGFHLAQGWLGLDELWLRLALAALIGIAGAFLAILLQRLAIGIAGFLLGGAAAGWAAEVVFGLPETAGWVAFVIGGILAALIAGFLFELALILFSSLLGASLVVQAAVAWPGVELGTTAQAVTFLVLTGIGLAAQAMQPRTEGESDRERRRRRRAERRRNR